MNLRACGMFLLVCALAPVATVAQMASAAPAATNATARPGVLTAAEAAKILPGTVFFRGLSASVQSRNSGGVRFADQGLMLVTLVDTSGYSTQVQEKYQAYLLTESALEIDGHRLPAGAYGCGFIAGDTFVVQDLGAHDLFTAHSHKDMELRRPTPLQVVAAPEGGAAYRLYTGRSYVSFRLAGSH